MCVELLRVFSRKIVLLSFSRNARLQRAFNGISSEIISSLVAPLINEYLRILQAQFCELWKIYPVQSSTRCTSIAKLWYQRIFHDAYCIPAGARSQTKLPLTVL